MLMKFLIVAWQLKNIHHPINGSYFLGCIIQYGCLKADNDPIDTAGHIQLKCPTWSIMKRVWHDRCKGLLRIFPYSKKYFLLKSVINLSG